MGLKIKFYIQNWLRSKPIYLIIQKYRKKTKHLVVARNTDIVIEGFQRSANSFTVHAIQYAQKEHGLPEINIAHHLHSNAQIKKAVNKNIPVILLIRKPEDAIASALVKSKLPIKQTIKSYINFYKGIDKHKDKYVVGEFNEVIYHFDRIIDKANKKFKLSLPMYSNKEKLEQYIFSISKAKYRNNENQYSLPNAYKENKKAEMYKFLEGQKYKSLIHKANHYYNKITKNQ